jgi:TonB family protein
MRSRYYAIFATILYGVGIALAMLYGVIYIEPKPIKEAELFVEFIETVPEVSTESMTSPSPDMAEKHQVVAEQDRSQQTEGAAPKTQTVNPRALFKMNQGGVDNAENSGNPYAQQSEEDSSSGRDSGLNPVGTEALDEGLQGRGLVGTLPMPAYPAGNRGGKVVVRVAVDREGKVTAATYEPKGSTTSDSSLVEAAIEAAKRARFTESAAFVQGGTITYIFKLKQ